MAFQITDTYSLTCAVDAVYYNHGYCCQSFNVNEIS